MDVSNARAKEPSEHPYDNSKSPGTDGNGYFATSASLDTATDTTPSEHQSWSTVPSPKVSAGIPSAHRDEPGFMSEERDNLRLMHHFAVSAHKSIAPSPGAVAVWRDLIPQLAFEYDFLLHGVLAVSALHLALTSQVNKLAHSALALRHYTAALALFRPHLDSITSSNIYPLFAFSCVVPVYIFGYPHVSQFPTNPLPEMLEMISVMRGCADIVGSGVQWLMNSPFKHLLLQPTDPSQALPKEIEDALTGLQERNNQTTTQLALRDAYATAIETLWECFQVAGNMPGEQAPALPFPVKLSAEVLMMMREGDPMALIILAHYGVILHWLDTVPWMKGWGSTTISAVNETVGEDWRQYIAWAVRESKKPTVRA
ncbi:hypothetical protein MMC26_005554 [Xylographa opegraphella]|nr:hypothetical protein [Xylographa opegraphella]